MEKEKKKENICKIYILYYNFSYYQVKNIKPIGVHHQYWINCHYHHYYPDHIYIYIWLNNKDTFCLYNSIKILSSFLISVLVFRLELVDDFVKIDLSTFGPFISHHQRWCACIKSILRSFFRLFYNITKLCKCRVG